MPRVLMTAVAMWVATKSATGGQFAPLDAWKAAVMAGDQAALTRLYSTDPVAVGQVGKTEVANMEGEWVYWAGLKSSVTRLNLKVLDIVALPEKTSVLLRIETGKADGEAQVAEMVQIWARQADGWRIISTGRSEPTPAAVRRLPEPATPNTGLYAPPGEAQAELTAALGVATREHKRVLVVFGANWCYDCHVLDATFHSKDFAPLVNAGYVVVHVNIGEEGKDNNDLAARLGVALDRGIPSLGVLDGDGKVVFAQQDGAFESTVKIGPEDVRAFLEKWKPQPR
jgi:thioredoxin 1